MNSIERDHLDRLDELVLNASSEELEKIQEIDYQTQLDGESFYHIYLDSDSLISPSIKKS
jgi:predicted secreted protein|tara:strand:- start:54 stop:233 length:180 start_codon:yes stop_codon:yes gene_type:complete